MFPETWEWDCIWMTLVVFVPSVFAFGLLFFPRQGRGHALVVPHRDRPDARREHRHVLELPLRHRREPRRHRQPETHVPAMRRCPAGPPRPTNSPPASPRQEPRLGRPLSVDQELPYRLLSRRRRHQHGPHPADHRPVLPGHDRQLEDRQVRARLLHPVFDPRNRNAGHVFGARLLPLLHLLGGDAPADVLPHRRVGGPRASTRPSSSSSTPCSAASSSSSRCWRSTSPTSATS